MKYLRVVFLFVFVFLYIASAQQIFKLDDSLTIDPRITTGKFENGLKYFIRVNKKPEKRAELRLAVKAGSVLEDDDQQGLAHFLEHMAFNGTKSFPKNELINFLEKEGVKLGPDVNAYTSFDETVYMLQIPTDSAALMVKAFQILGEWAYAVTMDDKEIDKERGVLVEEWRLGRGAFMRIQNKHNPIMFYKSKYAERLPIGKKEVLDTCAYDAIKRFYRDWYRPELMAVVAVGDFDPKEIEELIKKNFSALTNPPQSRKRTEFTLPDHTESLVSIATDKELPYTIVQVAFKRTIEDETKVRDYRKRIVSQIYDGMLNARLSERLQQPNPPFVMARSGDSRYVGNKQAYGLMAMVKENSIL
jgi:zinc protease